MSSHRFFIPVWSAPAISAAIIVAAGFSGSRAAAVVSVGTACAALVPLSALVLTLRRRPAARVVVFRLAAGVVLGIGVTVFGTVRLYGSAACFTTAFDSSTIVTLHGRVLRDLRPGVSEYRVLEVATTGVVNRTGWESAGRGRVVVVWKGGEYIDAGVRRVIPVRGDRIIVTGLRGITHERGKSEATVWVDPDQLFLQPVGGVLRLRRTARAWITARLARLDPGGGSMVPALLLGDRGALPRATMEAVRIAGASHVLALSGMHLGVLATILYLGPARFLARRLRGVAIFPLLAGYVWIAGWIPSLVRALILIGVAGFARVRMRSVPVPVLLAQTVVVTGLVAPRIVGNVGFQLSLLSLFGIVLFTPRLVDELSRFLPRAAAAYVSVTTAAMTTTAPLSLGVFGSVYPAGVLLAGVLSILIVVQMWAGIVFLLVATVPFLGSSVVGIVRWNGLLIRRVADLGYFFPSIEYTTGSRTIETVLTAIVLVGLAVWRIKNNRRRNDPRWDGKTVESQLNF